MGVSSQGDTDGPATTVREFNGVVGFVDLAGFTAATERLGRLGPRGTEQLGLLINDLFTPAIDIVHEAGGEIGWFAGDAMGVVFDQTATSGADAVRAMRSVSAAIDAVPPVETDDGPTTLAVKIGLAAGLVRWVTIDGPRLLSWFAGAAVDASADAEHFAQPGDVIVHRGVVADLDGAPVGADHVRFSAANDPPTRAQASPLSARRSLQHQPVRIARLAQAGDAALLDQHRPVTSMFVRFPESTHEPLLLARVRDIVEDLGGILQSATEGDKGALALALFGVPTALPDRGRRAVVAADRVRNIVPLAAVGIASGRVYAGRVGSERRWDYSLVGDRVNTAARLMQAAAAGEILLDDATLASAGPGLSLAPTRHLELKGKAGVEPASPLLAVVAGSDVADDSGVFVGRDSDVTKIEDALASPGLTLVTAPAGAGKSRLLRRVVASQTHRPAVVRIEPADRTRPLRLWRRLLATLFEVEEKSLHAHLETVFGDDDRYPLLGGVLGRPILPTALTAALSPDDRHEVLGGVLVDLVNSRSIDRPLIVEDLHWVDDSSLELLAGVAGRLGATGLAVVASARPDDAVEAIGDEPATRHHELRPIDAEAMAELMSALWGEQFGVEPQPDLRRELVERANGNPLFGEQLVAFAGTGGIEPTAAGLPIGATPETLTDLLLGRLDALPEAASTVASYAAVLGAPFTADDLVQSFGSRPGSERILGGLEILRDQQMVVGLTEHRFSHSLLSETAYARLSFSARADLHLAVVEMLESVRPDDVDELARHSLPTTDDDRKRRYFRLAGDRAREAFAQSTARRWYLELVDLLGGADRARIEVRLGEIEAVAGDLGVAVEHFEIARLSLDGSEQLELDLSLASVVLQRGDSERAFGLLDDAATQSSERSDWDLLHAALERAADLATMIGDLERAEAVEAEHRRLVDTYGPTHPAAREIRPLAPLHWIRGDLDTAHETYLRLYNEYLAADDFATAGAIAGDLAGICHDGGRIGETFEWLDTARGLFSRIGHQRAAVRQIQCNEATLRSQLGDNDNATRLGISTVVDALELGDIATLGHVLGILGEVPGVTAAEDLVRRALVIAEAAGDQAALLSALDGLARLAGATGDPQRALQVAGVAEARDPGRSDERSYDLLRWQAETGSVGEAWSGEVTALGRSADSMELAACCAHLASRHSGSVDDLRAARALCLQAHERLPSSRLRSVLASLGESVLALEIPDVDVPDRDLVDALDRVDGLAVLIGWQARSRAILEGLLSEGEHIPEREPTESVEL